MGSDGIKCVICVLLSTNGKDMSTSAPIQDGVNDAQQAVVMYDGQSLCVAHLHERVQSDSMDEFMRDVQRQLSGRRS